MMKRTMLLLAALSVGACTTAPYKQPLDAAASGKLSKPAIYAEIDDRGLGVQYFAQDNSAIGQQYGLVGAAVVGLMDQIANADPIAAAKYSADKLSSLVKPATVSVQFNEALQKSLAAVPGFDLSQPIRDMTAERKWEASAFSDPAALLTAVEYSLTQDFRTLQVVLTAAAVSREAAGPSINRAKSRPGKADAGIVYRNRISYYSSPLPASGKTVAEVEAEVDAIMKKYKSVPLAERKGPREKELAVARAQIAPGTIAELYVTQWLANDAALLHSAMKDGLTAVADLLAADLQDPTPVDTGIKEPKTTVVKGESRIVARSNQGSAAGTLSSEPADLQVPAFNGTVYDREVKYWYRAEK